METTLDLPPHLTKGWETVVGWRAGTTRIAEDEAAQQVWIVARRCLTMGCPLIPHGLAAVKKRLADERFMLAVIALNRRGTRTTSVCVTAKFATRTSLIVNRWSSKCQASVPRFGSRSWLRSYPNRSTNTAAPRLASV